MASEERKVAEIGLEIFLGRLSHILKEHGVEMIIVDGTLSYMYKWKESGKTKIIAAEIRAKTFCPLCLGSHASSHCYCPGAIKGRANID